MNSTSNNGATVRTRFAPSPTGDLHIGGVRTAMYAWLIARQSGGEFILRLEDTDQNREQAGSRQQIINTLDWLGIDRDEGPEAGGDCGPYLQSQRLEIYKSWADKLIAQGLAYIDTSSPEEVNAWRKADQQAKKAFLFRDHYDGRNEPIPGDWYGKYALRFRIDDPNRVQWHDEVRGDISAGPESLDDFVIIKADKFPTYNFAHIVDDAEMRITHIVRGEEFISSTPKYIRLYQALGIEPPKLITVPPMLGKNGGKKLSKRDGAQGALDYGREGFSVDTIWNFLCEIGWNDGTTDEIFTRSELLNKFSVQRIQKSGGRFDVERLNWISGQHIRRMTTQDLAETITAQEAYFDVKFWPKLAYSDNDEHRQKLLALAQEKIKCFADLAPEIDFFYNFEADMQPSTELLTKFFPLEQASEILSQTYELFADDSNFDNINSIEETMRSYSEAQEINTGKYFRLIRAAVTGREVAPGLFETIEALGQAETLSRLNIALEVLKDTRG